METHSLQKFDFDGQVWCEGSLGFWDFLDLYFQLHLLYLNDVRAAV